MQEVEAYFLRRLEEMGRPQKYSFSSGYMNWKRFHTIEQSFESILKNVCLSGKPLRILEIGCGDGFLIYLLLSKFGQKNQLQFTGIDLSEFDIDFAKKRREYHKISEDVCDFKVMNATQLLFADASFDVIIASELIEHIKDPSFAMKQMERVLKPCGTIVITTPNGNGSFFAKAFHWIDKLTFGWLKERFWHKGFREKAEDNSMFVSPEHGGRYGHLSVTTRQAWRSIFEANKLVVKRVSGTSGLIFGSFLYDRYRILFALFVILDVFLEKLPFSYFWSEALFFELKKQE